MIDWATAELAKRGLRVTGAATVIHDKPWAQVARVPTEDGATFVKTTIPALGHEMPVTALLARIAPEAVTRVIAHDDARRFLLMEDAGERLRSVLERDHDIGHWRGNLRRYAELQLAVAPHASALVAAGCPDMRAGALPRAFEALVADDTLVEIAGRAMAEQLPPLRALVPRVLEWDDELRGTVPETIQHDDLHDGQVFVRDGHVRFLDWGDANISHPFYSLVVAERSIAYSFELEPGAPELLRLRDEYIEPFTARATRSQIDAALRVALVLGRLVRALTWMRVTSALPAEVREPEAVSGWSSCSARRPRRSRRRGAPFVRCAARPHCASR